MRPTFNLDLYDEASEQELLTGVPPETPEWTNRPFVNYQDAIAEHNMHYPDHYDNPADCQATGDDGDRLEPEYFEPRPLKTRRIELETLGEPGSRAQCFGCVYFGEKDPKIPTDELTALIEMARQSIGRVDMLCLAQGMESYYEKEIRQKVNSRLMAGETPLPEWKAAQILEHIRMHNQDPLVQQVILLAETQELRAALFDCCFEVSSKTGKMRPNKFNIKSYEDVVKLQLFIQRQDHTKMAFTTSGALLNPQVPSQGLLSTNTKQLHSYWKT